MLSAFSVIPRGSGRSYSQLDKSGEYGCSYNPLALLFLPGVFPRGCFPSWEAEGEMGPQASFKGKVNMGKSPVVMGSGREECKRG